MKPGDDAVRTRTVEEPGNQVKPGDDAVRSSDRSTRAREAGFTLALEREAGFTLGDLVPGAS